MYGIRQEIRQLYLSYVDCAGYRRADLGHVRSNRGARLQAVRARASEPGGVPTIKPIVPISEPTRGAAPLIFWNPRLLVVLALSMPWFRNRRPSLPPIVGAKSR